MNLLHIIALYVAIGCVCLCTTILPVAAEPGAVDLSELITPATFTNVLTSVCLRFNALNSRIRDNRIKSSDARIEMRRLLVELREQSLANGAIEYPKTAWVFPLAGYDARAIGGGRRHGYSARGYDFFSGNRHGGHPSFDIFIRDRNQDTLDDRSHQPVNVLSMTGGVVVALEKVWAAGSKLRGGKYIWVYDPAQDLLVYYAHNADVRVELGDVVKPGALLATVGRSGSNAARRRSPTHLHLTVVNIRNGNFIPQNVYQDLARAVRLPSRT